MANNLQPTYRQSYPVGYPGMIANGEKSNRISRTIEDSAGIGFGKAAFRGAGDHGVTATPATGTFMGVTIADQSVQPLAGVVAGGAAPDVYPQYASVGLLNEGPIWVTAGSNTTDGAAVYVAADGTFTTSNTSTTAIPAVFDDTVTSGAMVRLRVRRA
ncbi:hypothetical protein SB2_11755 [Methylobacterium radiotolerans]|nr:hypothetical protein SB3_10950 [Methylobacterium radiotolerans]KTS47968.1 hypothetical protein SB2_11755 [Methylobacterium radiotolerans]